jgi:L-rhamnose mutarotase
MESQSEAQGLAETVADSAPDTAARCCFLLHVRTDRLDAYLEAHEHVWPEMQRALSDAGWCNYSLFLQKPTGMVVGYFEADDVELAQQAIAKTETNASWQRAMSQFFAAPDGGTNEVLPQYFHLA